MNTHNKKKGNNFWDDDLGEETKKQLDISAAMMTKVNGRSRKAASAMARTRDDAN